MANHRSPARGWSFFSQHRLVTNARLEFARLGLRILLADDDADTVWTLATILRHEGHSVQGVQRGADLLRAARFLRPDAAVIDLQMPGMSGYAVAQELRMLSYPRPAPLLVAISGTWTQGSDRLLAQQLGFDHHLAKPCDPDELVRVLAPLAAGAKKSL